MGYSEDFIDPDADTEMKMISPELDSLIGVAAVFVDEGWTETDSGNIRMNALHSSFARTGFSETTLTRLSELLEESDPGLSRGLRDLLKDMIPGFREKLDFFRAPVDLVIGEKRFTFPAIERAGRSVQDEREVTLRRALQVLKEGANLTLDFRAAIHDVVMIQAETGESISAAREALSRVLGRSYKPKNDLEFWAGRPAVDFTVPGKDIEKAEVRLELDEQNRMRFAAWELIYPEST